jgi:diaminopimelate decarboxylase
MSRVAHPAGPRHGDVLPADHPPAAPQDLNELHEEIWPRGARRSGGVLTLGGVDVRDLAADFGTPLYVCDEQDVRSRCREYLEAFGPDGRVFYAAKAFCSRAVLRWAAALGIRPAGFTPRLLAEPGELALLDALSWLPERVAVAARRGRPDEFGGYLAELAAHTIDTMSTSSFRKIPDISSERLWLADAARTGLAAGLGLLGIEAPARL